MRTLAIGLGLLGMGMALGLGACTGKSPLVGVEGEGEGGEGNPGPTPGPQSDGTVNSHVAAIRPLSEDEQPNACMPRALPVSSGGVVECSLFTLVPRQSGASCDCSGPGLFDLPEAVQRTGFEHLALQGACGGDPETSSSIETCMETYCACGATQLEGAERDACLNEAQPENLNGWCYVYPEGGLGSAELVAGCRDAEHGRVRYFGTAHPAEGFMILACLGNTDAPAGSGEGPAELGQPCLPSEELRQDFSSFAVDEVNVEGGAASCATGICLVNHFQGRVSCPYGQSQADLDNDTPQCFVPGTQRPVGVPVEPQLVARNANSTATCSCRCAGPGPGPFCPCPSSMECAPLVAPIGLPADQEFAGSYCVPRGTVYNPRFLTSQICDGNAMNCGDPNPY